jgi:predicted RNA polymerase sigma factor
VSEITAAQLRERVEDVYRTESRRVLATLSRLLGDIDLAEEALWIAFAAALEQWPRDGLPNNPRAWLISTGRFKAIDALCRRARFDATLIELAAKLADDASDRVASELRATEPVNRCLKIEVTQPSSSPGWGARMDIHRWISSRLLAVLGSVV